MRRNKIAASLFCGVMAASLFTGCGEVDKNAVVARFDDTEVSLGVANFAARLQQASYDDFYVAYFGETVWDSDLYGNGTTMQDEVKTGVLDSLFGAYTLQAHAEEYGVALSDEETAAIETAAADFVAANDERALTAMGADETIVKEYLTLITIQNKVNDAVKAEADVTVSDEEANTGAYSYVRIPKTSGTDADGNTADGQADPAESMKAFAEAAKADGMETAAEQYAYAVNPGTFTADDAMLDEKVLTALQGLDEGRISDVIETDEEYYVVRLDAKTDEEATENRRQSLIEERRNEYYNGKLESWKAEHTWTVDEKVWESVTFDNLFTTIEESTEALDATEDTGAAGGLDATEG